MNPTPYSNEEWASFLTGEMLLFGLLGKIIYTEPAAPWLAELRQADPFAEAPLGAEHEDVERGLALLRQWSAAALTPAAVLELQADYTALFCGPKKIIAPLWESVHFTEERLTFQERTLDVREWYRRFGLQPERLHREPDDHIGLELLFTAHLAGLAAQAQPAEAEVLIQAQREFMARHLLQWGAVWADQVIEHANTDFYRGIGSLTLGGLRTVAAILKVQIPAGEIV